MFASVPVFCYTVSMQIEGLITNENQWMFYTGAAVIALLFLLLFIRYLSRPYPEKIRTLIRKRRYMDRDTFMESWKRSKADFPGCYVVLIYDKKLVLNPLHYDDIYVGQSVNVRKRVFHHLKGHGNGDVYYGWKSGCKVYVLIRRCSRKKLNRREKELIAYFDATTSLNMTRGGSAAR